MYEYQLTIGLFDKDAEQQVIPTQTAKASISDILIDRYGIFAYTMIDCSGVYRMQSTGHIVFEPSIRIEIVTDDEINLAPIISDLKAALNQESIMIKKSISDIAFI